jgi:putative nucleotidyltransferase with HDIG domain
MNGNNISSARVASAVDSYERSGEAAWSIQYPSDGEFHFINSFFARILNRMDRIFLLETLVSIVRELVLNASKANYKRIFYKRRGLDVNQPDDYRRGMELFRNIIRNPQIIKKETRESDYRIDIGVRKTATSLIISIQNNCAPSEEEMQRILTRVEKAKSINDFTAAYDTVFDTSEGAGLGIVLIYLLLKNAGIDHSMLSMKPGKDFLEFTITVPDDIRRPEVTSLIKDSIINEVDALPSLPDYVIELKKMCSDPSVSIDELSLKIATAPSLAAETLRLANTAGFMPGRRINSIGDAIVIIGMKNLDLLLTMAAAKTILEQRYRRFEQIWNHCVKTASYARAITRIRGEKKVGERAYIAGLLHDIGKIVLLAVDMEKVRQIAEIVNNRKMISTTILEEISLGISHSQIGTMIARKWNFPEYIVASIENHHTPLNSADEHKNLTAIVYMANMLCEIENQNALYSFLESEILDFFALRRKTDFESFHESIRSAHAGQS